MDWVPCLQTKKQHTHTQHTQFTTHSVQHTNVCAYVSRPFLNTFPCFLAWPFSAAPIAVSAPEEGAVQCGVCEFWLLGRAQYDHHLKGRKHATRLKRLARLQDECKSFARLHQTQSFLSRELELVSNYLMRRRPESSPASQSCQLGIIASWQRSEFRKEVSQSISAMRVCSRGVRSHVVIGLLEYWIGTLRRS